MQNQSYFKNINKPTLKVCTTFYSSTIRRKMAMYCMMIFFSSVFCSQLTAQVDANGYGFNYFPRQWFDNNSSGAGYSFYAAVWPIMEQYPGPENFQLGLPSTWLSPFHNGDLPEGFYNTIEGGLGWWGDTRFATETPKFIMGGVANGFSQWANGTGAGSGPLLFNGLRDWSTPGGKYGIAQLSPNLLWPPDGLNMEQGANGEFLGYGYHPLPITDVMEETYGVDYSTGNQCWTLFMNANNFSGPVAFFIPTFWTETALNTPIMEGLFLDTKDTDRNQAFAIEYASSPALISSDDNGDSYARILPLTFPETSDNTSEVIREVKVFTKEAKWNEVESWFNGGAVPSTTFQTDGIQDVFFNLSPSIDGNISTENGTSIDAEIDFSFGEKIVTSSGEVAGFEWNTDVVDAVDGSFVMPEYYKLTADNLWEAITTAEVPPSTGLLTNEPTITPRNDEVPYLTPLESDCPFQDPQSAWNSPGPSAGPYFVSLGDGSRLTYHWYKFIDQPAVIHANLPEEMRQNMQDRIEKIHTHWKQNEEYIPEPTDQTLVGLDDGLLVTPPAGMEIGYVPIVTRQEKDTTTTSIFSIEKYTHISVYPNPTTDLVRIETESKPISGIQLFNAQGVLIASKIGLNVTILTLQIDQQPSGIYFLKVTDQDNNISNHRIVKSQ